MFDQEYRDSNPDLHFQLYHLSYIPNHIHVQPFQFKTGSFKSSFWLYESFRQESNQWHSEYKTDVLPTELLKHGNRGSGNRTLRQSAYKTYLLPLNYSPLYVCGLALRLHAYPNRLLRHYWFFAYPLHIIIQCICSIYS